MIFIYHIPSRNISSTLCIIFLMIFLENTSIVNPMEKRITEAQKLGFKRIIIPESNEVSDDIKGIEVLKVKRIIEAITRAVSK